MDTSHDFRRIVCGSCGHVSDVPIYCGDRFCPVCSGPRRKRLRERFTAIVSATPRKSRYRWRFVTLTIPSQEDPKEALDTLYERFKRLRQRKWWKSYCLGGICGAEITRSLDKWHVHLHIILYSTFIPQSELAKRWRQVSPGRIVDIRLLPETTAISYILKYITKPALGGIHRETACRALASRRLYSTFGICHSIKVAVERVPYACPVCGQTHWLMYGLLAEGEGYTVDCISSA